jgi:glycosyltransferase involved in cell wall biosynthesis
MRIFHIMVGQGNGGAETYAADMMIGLHELGVQQQAVLHPRQIRLVDVRAAGVTVLSDVMRWPLGFVQKRLLQQAITAYQPDLVHCWMRRSASLVPQLTVPTIGWFGGYYQVEHFQRCSHFVGVTPDIVAHQRTHGVVADHSFFVPTFPVTDETVAVDRTTLNTPADATVLLTLSRLHPKKGLDNLLQALKDLPNCILWLAGDGPLRDTLRAQAEQMGVLTRVRFLGWRNDRGALLRAADICVLPSRYEPFGTVMLEAWASHTPLVAAAAAGPAAFVRHGENGLLVPVNDGAALAVAIQQVQKDAVLRARIINGGDASYQAQFTRPAVVQQMFALYQQIIAGGR